MTTQNRRDDLEAISLGWEQKTGYDSIATVDTIYSRTHTGAIRCVFPGCRVVRHDPLAMWQHVHTGHGNSNLPPDDFDPGPWL